jgi:hypothetical protein
MCLSFCRSRSPSAIWCVCTHSYAGTSGKWWNTPITVPAPTACKPTFSRCTGTCWRDTVARTATSIDAMRGMIYLAGGAASSFRSLSPAATWIPRGRGSSSGDFHRGSSEISVSARIPISDPPAANTIVIDRFIMKVASRVRFCRCVRLGSLIRLADGGTPAKMMARCGWLFCFACYSLAVA